MKTVLLIFAKSPILGKVKNRLSKNIGLRSSLLIYKKLLEHTASVAQKSRIKTVLFQNEINPELKATFKNVADYQIQEGKNLGEKMETAFRWAFSQKYENVILIGSDLWSLDKYTLIEAKKALENNDIVIGPCYDGGYYLIGMKNINNKIFKNISWSKKQVFKQTLSKVLENSVYYLEIKNDIDNKESLKAHTSLYDLYKKTLS
jgi:hypothetical protein